MIFSVGGDNNFNNFIVVTLVKKKNPIFSLYNLVKDL